MKKTLFLSAILGAALCSSAFAQLTINVGAGQQVTQGAVNTSDGKASTIDSLGELTITGRLYFDNNSTATFTATGESIKSTYDGFWLQLQGGTAPASASLLAHDGQTATYNATGDIAVYKNSTLTIGSGVTLNTRGIFYSSTNTADNGAVQLEDNAHVNLTKKSVFHDLVIGSNSSVANTEATLADTVTMAGRSSLSLSSSTINNLTVTGSDNTFSSRGSSTITTLTVNADSALNISNTTLKAGSLSLSGNLVLNSQAKLNLDTLQDFSHVTLNSGSTLNLTLGETDRISEDARDNGNGLGSAQYTYTYAGPQMNGGQLKLNGAAASIADGVLSGSNGTYYINDAASFTGNLDGNLEGAMNLVINGGTVTTVNDNSNGVVSGDIVVNTATLSVTGNGHDAFGYYKAGATKSITLNGTDAAHKAILSLDYTNTNTVTMTTNLVMNGNAEVSGTRGINTFRDGAGTGNITASGKNNEIKVGVQIRRDTTVTVNDGGELTLSGNISGGTDGTGTLTKAGNGTLTITGNISAGTINGGNTSKTTIIGNTISGGTISNATISNSTISGGTINVANVNFNDSTFSGAVAITGGQVTKNGTDLTFKLADGATVTGGDASNLKLWLAGGSTLTTLNASADTQTTGGTLAVHNFLSGYTGSAAGNLDIGEKTTLRITGTADGNNSNGFVIWTSAAHQYNINGALLVEGGAHAQTASNAIFNVGSTGLLQLNKGLLSQSNTSLGTINVSGTLAIGADTTATGSKTTVNLNNGATVTALDENTATAQIFTLNNQATVTFSGKGVDGTANNTLTVKGTINNSTAAVDSIGKVTFGDMTTKSLMVDGYTTVGALETSSVDMKDQSTLMLKSTYDATKLTVAADASAKLFVQTVEANTGVGHAATHHVGSVVINDNATLTFGGANAKVDSLTLGNGATLTLGDNNTHNYNFTTSSLTVEGNSTINANLVVTDNGTMDFSNHTELTMGCTVSIGDHVTIKIDETELASIVNTGAVLVIITDVEGVDTDNLALTLGSDWKFVDSHDQSLDAYNLRLDVVDAGNGKYNIVVAPEPATATLSLLALAALTARRRRH